MKSADGFSDIDHWVAFVINTLRLRRIQCRPFVTGEGGISGAVMVLLVVVRRGRKSDIV